MPAGVERVRRAPSSCVTQPTRPAHRSSRRCPSSAKRVDAALRHLLGGDFFAPVQGHLGIDTEVIRLGDWNGRPVQPPRPDRHAVAHALPQDAGTDDVPRGVALIVNKIPQLGDRHQEQERRRGSATAGGNLAPGAPGDIRRSCR